ncbi:MAG: hypothetical protein ABIS36_14980 [Chryseolinea sp.]
MSITKKIGIWMDHQNAHLMEFHNDEIKTETISSEFTHEVKEETLQSGEFTMHNKERHQQTAFYKSLAEFIKPYGEVLLFGPTNAKEEFHNMLKADHHFAETKIEVEQSDKMSDNQQHAFVRKHFAQPKVF